MTRFDFIFYRDTEGSGAWHDTLAVTGTAAAADASPASGGRVVLDPYGRTRTSQHTGSKASVPAASQVFRASEGSAAALTCRLVSFAAQFALYGNVWQQWIAYMIMMHENAFTIACERKRVSATSTLMKLAQKDFEVLRGLFISDPGTLSEGAELLSAFTDYRIPYAEETESTEGRQIRRFAGMLANSRDANDFGRSVTQYYAEYGTGIYGIYRAFRVSEGEGGACIVPVKNTADVRFSDLIGYEEQKKTLKENTEAFLRGGHANNVLLYGDSGTGKSTSVHALMHDYYSRGLRLVEIGKQDRYLLPGVLAEVKKRSYRFILFLDDLSFEEDESDYKELKAMLEGALESLEDRALIYATSNRRHLIRETWNDRTDMEHDGDIHRSDTMEEKLSLAGRFGVSIYYPKPDYDGYIDIVRALADRNGIRMSEEELGDEARKWEIRHGGTSGRTASQLITWLGGTSK